MDDRAFWYPNPDALIVGAAQALEAKQALAQYLGCRWEDVDAGLSAALLEVLRGMPEPERLRRREDRRLLSWVSRLVAEMPDEDPRKVQVQRRLREKLR